MLEDDPSAQRYGPHKPTRATRFTGFIAPEIGNLSLLIKLDLGHNKLFGEEETTVLRLVDLNLLCAGAGRTESINRTFADRH